jgi:hypothetical protein
VGKLDERSIEHALNYLLATPPEEPLSTAGRSGCVMHRSQP